MRILRVFLIGAVAAVALAACGPDAAKPSASGPSSPSASVPPASSAATPPSPGATPGRTESTVKPPPPPTLTGLTIRQTGGIAGVDNRWTVGMDGTWMYTDRAGKSRTGKLTQAQNVELAALINDPALTAELKRPAANAHCADGFAFDVTVADISTRLAPCSDGTPAFSKLLSTVQRLTAGN